MSLTPDSAGGPPLRPVEFCVAEPEAGLRLDVLLTIHFHDYSRAHLRRVISAGGVTIDGKGGKPAYHVRAGQRVCFLPPRWQARRVLRC